MERGSPTSSRVASKLLVVLIAGASAAEISSNGHSDCAQSSLQGSPIAGDDLRRAKNKVPGIDFQGLGISHMSHTLNSHLYGWQRRGKLNLQRCETMQLDDLHQVQSDIVKASHPDFQKLYSEVSDNRRYRFCGLKDLVEKYSSEKKLVEGKPELAAVLRDSKCRESVMWYVHHLRREEKDELHNLGFTLPTLPSHEVQVKEEEIRDVDVATVYRAYNDSLQCTTCHARAWNHTWPSNAGINKRTGEKVPSWPNEFDVEFNLEVLTEKGQKGLSEVHNATGNHFYYKWNPDDTSKSVALNTHDVCPFFPKTACNIYHQPDGIFLQLKKSLSSWGSFCCLAFPIPVIPPFWTTWGSYVDTYEPNQVVGDGQDPVWEGFRSDRYIFGDAGQGDEHDLFVRADDPKALVRFHATIPPPNNHSHGYWHVMSDMNVRPQDASMFEKPKFCLPTCGLGPPHLAIVASEKPAAIHPLFPWASINEEGLKHLEELWSKHEEQLIV